MKEISLQEKLEQVIGDLKKGKIGKEVISFQDFKTRYAFPKPSACVRICLTNGVTADIDILEFLEGVVD